MISYQIEQYETLASTQDIAHQCAQSGVAEGLVIQALEMTSGRGRQGHSWIAEKGNLYFSLVLRPGCPAQIAGQLAFVSAVSVSQAIKEIITGPCNITLKWPNDILLNGQKACGILLESELHNDQIDYLILGIGLNIKAPPEERAGLEMFCENNLEVDACRDIVLTHFSNTYVQWQERGFTDIRQEWVQQAYKLGQEITVSRGGGAKLKGIFEDLDEEGYLVLSTSEGTKKIGAGEIF